MKQRIGIFGGTFDPPHIGHLILAAEAYARLKLNCLLWVLTPSPPHKLDIAITPVRLRHKMIRAFLKGAPEFELSTVDIDRPAPHYALDTVKILNRTYPDGLMIYIMGGDSLRDLPTWHQPEAFLDACHEVGVIQRHESKVDLEILEKKLPGISSKVCFIESPRIEISSQDIRRRIAEGGHFRYYLHPQVYEIILEHNLYH
jgi:nicotinate-nucleotide adenylyltransferase